MTQVLGNDRERKDKDSVKRIHNLLRSAGGGGRQGREQPQHTWQSVLCGDEGAERRRGVEEGKCLRKALNFRRHLLFLTHPVFFERESFPLRLSGNVIIVATAPCNHQSQASGIGNSEQMSGGGGTI